MATRARCESATSCQSYAGRYHWRICRTGRFAYRGLCELAGGHPPEHRPERHRRGDGCADNVAFPVARRSHRWQTVSSRLSVADIYMLISGSNRHHSLWRELAVAAEHFVSLDTLRLFIFVGLISGAIAALMPIMLEYVVMFDCSSRNYVLSQVFSQKNSHGVAYFSLFAVITIATLICASGTEFGVLITAFSFCNTLTNLPL